MLFFRSSVMTIYSQPYHQEGETFWDLIILFQRKVKLHLYGFPRKPCEVAMTPKGASYYYDCTYSHFSLSGGFWKEEDKCNYFL